MSLTYNTFAAAFAEMLVVPATDANYVAMLPQAIDSAEQRMYRDLDLLATYVTDATGALASGNRNFALPGGNAFFVVETINAITPAGTTDPQLGKRSPVLPADREFCDMLYPSSEGAGVPAYFARTTQSTIVVAPWPDGNYTLEVYGTQRPAPLSITNQVTFLSQNLPDVFLAAAMIFGSAWQMNFSAMGDNPTTSMSWDTQYKALLAGAGIEEARKKFTSEGWSSAQPAPLAKPPRT